MSNHNFTRISQNYEKTSIVQSSAADILISLLDIRKNESVLDVGCGTGNLTKKIYKITFGEVTGIDPSDGMIEEARKNYGESITFKKGTAEDIREENRYDVIFCNSAFQWVRAGDRAVMNFRRALKKGGRVGIQAPATQEYCPNFVKAVDAVRKNGNLGGVFEKWVNPWLFLESAESYAALFRKSGLEVSFSRIQTTIQEYTPDKVYSIFASGAIAGYLNRDFYGCELRKEYVEQFQDVVKKEFQKQVNGNGMVELEFRRIFLVGFK